jgi:hypothetical protein
MGNTMETNNRNYFQRYLRNGKYPYGFFIADLKTGAYGWSLCNPLDKFSKKVAREKAIERMEKEYDYLYGNINDVALYDVVEERATKWRAMFRVFLHARAIYKNMHHE